MKTGIPSTLTRGVVLSLMLGVSLPAFAASVETTVKDDTGNPVPDAVVYATAVPGRTPLPRSLATSIMDQQNKEFVPYVLPVQVGTSVLFPNLDNIRHHVYSFSRAKKFELPLYIGTPANPVVFDKPGIVELGCNIHDWMIGHIYVLETPYFEKTGANGKARIQNVHPGAYEVRVWHPRMKGSTDTTGQRLTLVEGASAGASFVLSLKRDWRLPRQERYDRQPQN